MRKIYLYHAHRYLHDHLGNTRIVYHTNRECGENDITYHAEYMGDYYPYGKTLREYSAGKVEKYLTTHHERDQETGLDYRGARFYDSDIGRFLSVDPLAADFASWSPYNYVLGNPVMMVDPDGKAPQWPTPDTVWDGLSILYDVGKIGYGYATGNPAMVTEGGIDLASDVGALFIPGVPAGATKLARYGDDAVEHSADAMKTFRKDLKGASGKGDAPKGMDKHMDEMGEFPKSKHGNSKDSDAKAYLYEKYDKNGNFQKNGITQDPATRYGKEELDGGYLKTVDSGKRSEMLKKERQKTETNPGPQNKEPWAGNQQK